MTISSIVVSRYVFDELTIIGVILVSLGSVYMAVDVFSLKQTLQRLTLVLIELPIMLLPFIIVYLIFFLEDPPPILFFISLGLYLIATAVYDLILWSTPYENSPTQHWGFWLIFFLVFTVMFIFGYFIGALVIPSSTLLRPWWSLLILSVVYGLIITFIFRILVWLIQWTDRLSTTTLAVIGLGFVVCSAPLLLAGTVAADLGIQIR